MDALSRESEEWTLASDKKLLDWMQAFTTRVERRCHGVGSRIDLLLAQVKALDASLQNTCNHFSSLSSSQYLENRIAEEDEVVVRANPADAAQQPLPSVGVTEADIHSRYRRATHVALQAVQSAVEQTQEVMRSGAQRLPLMHAKGAVSFEGPLRPLPYIIGSAAYANDSACGLAEAAGNRGGGFRGAPAPSRQLREENNTWNYSENLSQSLEEGRSGAGSADMAFNAKVARQFGDDTRQADGQSVSGNRSRNGHVASPGATSSGTAGAEIRVVEPAVSTVDGFRAMLEAALRGPADLYDDTIPDGMGLLSEPAIFQDDYYDPIAGGPNVREGFNSTSFRSSLFPEGANVEGGHLQNEVLSSQREANGDMAVDIDRQLTSREEENKKVDPKKVESSATLDKQRGRALDFKAVLGLDVEEDDEDLFGPNTVSKTSQTRNISEGALFDKNKKIAQEEGAAVFSVKGEESRKPKAAYSPPPPPPPVSAFVRKLAPANRGLPSGGLFDEEEDEGFEDASAPRPDRTSRGEFRSSEEGRKLGKNGTSTETRGSTSYNGGAADLSLKGEVSRKPESAYSSPRQMPPPISAFVMKIPPANSRLPSGGLFDDDEEEDFEHASGPGDGRSRAFSSSEEGRKLGKQGASTGTSNSSSYNGGRSLFTAEERGGGSSAEGEADSVSGGSNATVNDGYKGKIEAALEKGFLKLGGGSVITKTVAEKNCIEGLFDVGQQGKLISSQNEPAKMDGWKEPSVKAVGRAGSLGLFDDDDELEDEFHVGPGERAASRGSSNGTSNRAVPKEEPISLSGLFGIPSKRSSENAVQGILKLESATFPRKGGLFDESEDDEEGSTAAIEETVSEADKYLSGIGSGAVEGRQVLAGAVRVLEEASSAPSVNASTRSKLLASAVAALRRPRSDESEDEFEVSQSDEEEENKVPQSTERRIFEPKPADEGWVIGSDQETRVAEFDSGRAVEGRRVERMEKDGAEGAEREGDRKVAVRNDMNQMNFAVGLEAALKRRAGGGGLFGGDNDEASGDEESPRERFLGMKEGEESRSSVNGQGAGNSPVDPVREILGERNIFSAASSINRASNVDMNSEVISRADGNGISHIGGLPQGLVVAPEKRLLGDGARAEDHGGSTSFSWKPVIGKREVEKLGGEKKTFDSLFGNDDDEEEDALFGPLNGKGSKFTSSDLFSRG